AGQADCASSQSAVAQVSMTAVIGSYRGYTSAVMQILRDLDCYTGDCDFEAWTGYSTFEDAYLRRCCLRCFDEREGNFRLLETRSDRECILGRWASWARRRAVLGRHRMVAAKHPSLCMLVNELVVSWTSIAKSLPKLISVDRPVSEICESWKNARTPHGHPWWPRKDIRQAVETLIETRDTTLRRYEHHTLPIEHLKGDPDTAIEQLASYIQASPDRVGSAVKQFKLSERNAATRRQGVVPDALEGDSRGSHRERINRMRAIISSQFADVEVRKDHGSLPISHILCVILTFNERVRLPDTVRHYRQLGVDRFAILDNGSDDGTCDWASDQPDVDLFRIRHPFRNSFGGAGWISGIVREFYGVGRWSIYSDADEQLVYDGCESHGLHQLTAALKRARKDSLPAVMVDMYSDKGFLTTLHHETERLMDTCPWFDGSGYQRTEIEEDSNSGPPRVTWSGGAMERVFGAPVGWLAKIPLVYWRADTQYWNPHVVHPFENNLSRPCGAVLHFKLLSDFAEMVSRESDREQHAENARKYKNFQSVIAQKGNLSPFYSASVRYRDSKDLVAAGLIDRIRWA
ncbi:MAG: glycosyltransferase family 2 protein, partial [Planctomycetota bacterium]